MRCDLILKRDFLKKKHNKKEVKKNKKGEHEQSGIVYAQVTPSFLAREEKRRRNDDVSFAPRFERCQWCSDDFFFFFFFVVVKKAVFVFVGEKAREDFRI